jgi:hypothetical protein
MDDRKGKSSILDRILLRDGDLRLGGVDHDDLDGLFNQLLRDDDRLLPLLFRKANSALLSAKKRAGRGKRHIVIPPGSKLLTIAEFFYSKKTYTLHFEPIVADMQREYFEALYEKRVWKARWIHIRGCWGFISAMGLNICVSLLDKAWKAWKMSDK